MEKIDTDLRTALVMLLAGRTHEEFCEALALAVGDEKWNFTSAWDKAIHNVTMYGQSADHIRERLEEKNEWETDPTARFKFAPDVTDAVLYNDLMIMDIPDQVFEAMGYCLDDLFDQWKKDGTLVPVTSEG